MDWRSVWIGVLSASFVQQYVTAKEKQLNCYVNDKEVAKLALKQSVIDAMIKEARSVADIAVQAMGFDD